MTLTQTEADRRSEQGKRIRMARARPGWSQQRLANEVTATLGYELSRGTFQLIESGHRDAERGVLGAIAATTNVDLDWLLGLGPLDANSAMGLYLSSIEALPAAA